MKEAIKGTQIKKNEGPTCACGSGDLYSEWLKQNEKEKDETVGTLNLENKNIADSLIDSDEKR
jgi:hypothetical protein